MPGEPAEGDGEGRRGTPKSRWQAASEQLPRIHTARLRARNDRVVRRSLAVYLVLVAALAASDGVQLTPDVFVVGSALVTALIAWRLAGVGGRHPVRDWLPFVLLALSYELIRGFGPILLRNVHIDEGAMIDRAFLNGAIASDVLQRSLRPLGAFDALALAATVIYAFHTLLPIVVGAYLWSRHGHVFYDFVAALVILSIAAFATYLLWPSAPPWWAALSGHLSTAAGQPVLGHLEGGTIDAVVGALGLQGSWLTSFAFGSVSPDPVAAFPSLHAAYPVLAYLCLREVGGPGKWLMLGYIAGAWLSIVYLGDHYLIDIAGGFVYAGVAWRLVRRSAAAPGGARAARGSPTGHLASADMSRAS
ncbi:MAG: phosphatase PAP2 family protein [Vicinamibacterales bacterium]